MNFTSPEYLLGLILGAWVFAVLPYRGRLHWLLACSLAFYASLSLRYLPVLLIVIFLNYGAGRLLELYRSRWILLATLCFNFGLLASFKYVSVVAAYFFPPFQQNEWVGGGTYIPIGVSFFTFQASGYVIDVFRGTVSGVRSPSQFALFISAFPQLVVGPIERAGHFLPQIAKLPTPTMEDWGEGAQRILMGLVRKLVIADGLGAVAHLSFGVKENSLLFYLSCLLFALQLYCDFAGYCDIAVGSGRFFGLRLSENFRVPFEARHFSDFWHRWHGTLHLWLKEYLFLPLARIGCSRTIGVVAVFLVSGAWHGNTWNFVAMGAVFAGVYLAGRWVQLSTPYQRWHFPGKGLLERLWVLHGFAAGLIFFRTRSMEEARAALAALRAPFHWTPEVGYLASYVLPLLGLAVLLDLLTLRPRVRWGFGRAVVQGALLGLVLLWGADKPQQFFYFAF